MASSGSPSPSVFRLGLTYFQYSRVSFRYQTVPLNFVPYIFAAAIAPGFDPYPLVRPRYSLRC